jgi:hypothetical protein
MACLKDSSFSMRRSIRIAVLSGNEGATKREKRGANAAAARVKCTGGNRGRQVEWPG